MASVSMAQQAAGPAAGQPAKPEDLPKIYNDGMAAFNKGDYATAISNLELILSKADPTSNLEGVYYTLGAAYFNNKDYGKAIETLKKYQTTYPKGARIVDVVYFLGMASFLNNDYPAAIESFKRLEGTGYRDQALYYGGMAYKEASQPDDAIASFEKLVSPEISSPDAANAAILLVGLYAKKHDLAKATAMIQQIKQKLEFVDNIENLNSQASTLGDELVDDHQPLDAILCYRMVRSREDLIKFQNARIEALEKKIQENTVAMQTDTMNATKLNLQNNQLRAQVANAKKMLESFDKMPDIQEQMLLRYANAYYQAEKRWEAIVAYDEFLRKYPDSKFYEEALFSMIVASSEVTRPAKTREYAEIYLKKYPTGAHAFPVGYLLGASALQANDPENAEKYFLRMIDEQPTSNYREEMMLQLGNTRYALGKFEDAIKDYEKYKTEYPNGKHTEEVNYRIALSYLFAGKYEEAMKRINEYLAAYPAGLYVPDAKYRLDVCKYAAQLYDEVIYDTRAWEAMYGNKDPMLGEVLALLADALAATGKEDEAIQIYIRASQAALTDEVKDYALTSGGKLLQKKGQWDKLSEMYENFIKQNPDNNSVVTAIFWIGKAKVHDGKTDEAKQYIADNIKKYIDDPKREAVDQLISQLVQLCVRKKPKPVADATPAAVATGTDAATSGTGAVAAATPVPTPTPAPTPEVDPGAELETLLGSAEKDKNPTAQARILFAKAQLALLRKNPAEQQKDFQTIADKFEPEDLSPIILAQTGDYLLAKGDTAKAETFYQQLIDLYPKSDVVDYAYNGLGEIAYQKKEYEKALKLYTDAIDKGAAAQKLKDVTIGKAKTLMELDRLDDAKKLYEQIGSIREWRGDATAYSLYMLGQINQKQGKYADAIANYQRVFVAYQRYLQWVAKSYIASAECFEKMGKSKEALNTYAEMTRNDKLSKFPEMDIARKRLQEAGQ